MEFRHAIEASPSRESVRGLPRLSRRAGFWAVGFSFLVVTAFSTAPSSLYGPTSSANICRRSQSRSCTPCMPRGW
jgi:hypothetical protein